MLTLLVNGLSKRFGARLLFDDLNLSVATGQSLAVVGPNGSGKSTLLQILAGLQRGSRGEVHWRSADEPLPDDTRRNQIGFVAPYLNLYDQLTADENLKFFAAVSGGQIPGKQIDRLLETVGLQGRRDDPVGEYSSGMKQRLKYAIALSGEPGYLFLDEPTANLDEEGKAMVRRVIDRHRDRTILVLATNERSEYEFADQQCRLG